MTASTTLQLKISRTRKRLSNNTWYLPLIVLAAAGLMIYLSYMLRAISIAGRYGLIESEIPVLPVPLLDETLTRSVEKPRDFLGTSTPVVLLSKEAFFFGMGDAFAADLSNVRNKFFIPHESGAPNVPKLINDLDRWLGEELEAQAAKQGPKGARPARPKVLLFVPLEEIPMAIVIQCLASLRNSGKFETVILGGGLL